MTKEITKAIILQEMEDKLALRELEPERFRFSEMVVPVYNIEQHLLREEVRSNTFSVTGTGAVYAFSVPANEKWYLHGYNVIFVTGAYTIAGLMITRQEIADYIYIDLKAAQNVSYSVNLPKDIVLHPEDDLRIYVDGYTSTGNLTVIIDTTVEALR